MIRQVSCRLSVYDIYIYIENYDELRTYIYIIIYIILCMNHVSR